MGSEEPVVITPEIVPPVKTKAKKKTGSYPLTPKQIRKRDHSFTDVAIFDEKTKDYIRSKFSERERKIVQILLKTGSAAKAAEEIGVTTATVYNYIKRPFVKAYLEMMRERAAGAADLTIEKITKVINGAVDGKELTPMQLQAAALAAKILQPVKGNSITVNTQNNYNGVSPFANLEQGAMLDEIKRNLLEMQGDDAA